MNTPIVSIPHVYGVEADMGYYVKMDILGQMGCYDKFHEQLLQNDVTTSVVQQTNPFVVHHVIAHLLRDEYTIPVDLLPSLECSLHSHHRDLTSCKDELWEFLGKMDQKLHQISLQEAATPSKAVIVGRIVPSQRDSDSSFQSEEAVQLDSRKTANAPLRAIQAGGPASSPLC